MTKSQDEIMAQERIESQNQKYPMESKKVFTATVLDPSSPGGVRLIREERPYVFVDETKPEIVIR